MTSALFFMLTGVLLFVMGLYALVVHAHVLRKIIAVNILGTGVFMVFIAGANRDPGLVPDPVPHALVLTGIVVAVSATALALVIATLLYRHDAHPGAGEE